jgi:mono/diheme cytochrome c family protein
MSPLRRLRLALFASPLPELAHLAWPTRRLGLALLASLAACSAAPPPWEEHEPWSDAWIVAHGETYVSDVDARREAMEASLTNPENLYAQARLGAYATGEGGWDALPEWNPRVEPLTDAHVDALARGERPDRPSAPFWDGATPSTFDQWAALGERVFFELPLRDESLWEPVLVDPALAAEVGLERDAGEWPGFVWIADVEGRASVAITCALCHVARRGTGPLETGRARRSLDYGRAQIASAERLGRTLDPVTRARFESWGPGRADVIEDVADTPIAIPDLWGLREQRFLTQAGTLTHRDPMSLAIRQETQYVQANRGRTRPPRVLMFALAVFLYAIAPPPARPIEDPAAVARGESVFRRECVRCHSLDNGSGALVPSAEVGTNPELADGGARGTGAYRPAPLLRVADAAPYLHHGAIDSLESLLSAERAEPGHLFGTDLLTTERDDLLAWLRTR